MMNTKNNLYRFIAPGFLSYSLVWIIVILWGVLINPHFGIQRVEDLDNGKLILALVKENPLVLVFPSFDFLPGLLMVLISVLIPKIYPHSFRAEMTKLFGAFSGLLFIYGAYSRVVTFRYLASNETTPDDLRYFGYDLVNQLQHANSYAVQGFLSLWLITLHLLLIKTKKTKRFWPFAGIALGSIGVFTVLFQPLALVVVIGNVFTGIFGFIHFKRQNTITY